MEVIHPAFAVLAAAAARGGEVAEVERALTSAIVALTGATRVELLHPALAGPAATWPSGPAGETAGTTLPVPVRWGGATRRMAVVHWAAGCTLDAETLAVCELLADHAAAGFARLENERALVRGVSRDHAVVRAAHALGGALELDDILATLVTEAAAALDAELAGVYLGPGPEALVATAGHGLPALWLGLELREGDGAAGEVLRSGTTAITARGQERGGALTAAGHAAVAVPMHWDGALRGVLSVAWTAPRRVIEPDVRALEAITGFATLACRNATAFERAQQAARTDALTGLLNHGAMQVRIREEIARAARDETTLSCVIIDLDDFKAINDTQGHQAGDEMLRRVAGLLAAELRPYDSVARYGGDEFVLMLPGSDDAAAAQVAERVRDALDGACSIGVAAWRPGLDASDLIEDADRALLLAKRTGKGRVAMADAELESELALMHAEQGSPAAVQALAAAIEERDGYTQQQSAQVVRLARGVAMLLGMAAAQTERIAQAALLHDVGKLGVPREVLDKRGPLTPEEWRIIAEHPLVGERILLRAPELAPLAPIVRHEHEHWDGSGYPDSLEGTAIPIGSRIILACDAFVAMCTDRPYRPALAPAEAARELQTRAGRQFDPEVVEALLDLSGLAG